MPIKKERFLYAFSGEDPSETTLGESTFTFSFLSIRQILYVTTASFSLYFEADTWTIGRTFTSCFFENFKIEDAILRLNSSCFSESSQERTVKPISFDSDAVLKFGVLNKARSEVRTIFSSLYPRSFLWE